MIKDYFESAGLRVFADVMGFQASEVLTLRSRARLRKPYSLVGLTFEDELQEGDEYLDHYMKWQPVPTDFFGAAASDSNFIALRRKEANRTPPLETSARMDELLSNNEAESRPFELADCFEAEDARASDGVGEASSGIWPEVDDDTRRVEAPVNHTDGNDEVANAGGKMPANAPQPLLAAGEAKSASNGSTPMARMALRWFSAAFARRMRSQGL
jgi:hypothetical protein